MIDPRGPRLAAALTLLVLATALLLAPSQWTLVLLTAQALVFAIGAGAGVRRTPYGLLFAKVVRPRLGPPTELEDEAPPRFAQAVGLVFTVVALVGYGTGVELLGALATGLAVAAAFLNAVFGYCLGCEMYLILKRITTTRTFDPTPAGSTPVAER